MASHYRSDVDGLRAVAVLSVLFFHIGSSVFSGGYVGVDVFFVISGYLITQIIVRKIARNDFSIVEFYERRFRRIIPALVTVAAVTLAVGTVILTPSGLLDLGQSAVATALFSSNILFYLESGYFDTPATMKPLLHTWSLAVEEQYYIFFPLLLLFIAKADSKRYLRWLLALGALSFIACVIVTGIDQSAAFYLIPTRAWQLFTGSVLALHLLPNVNSRLIRETTAALGLALIAYGVFAFSADTRFPGFAAAIPTVGTALIIYAGIGEGKSFVSSALSLRPVVFIGLISYSLYLWHWPVIVYTQQYLITEPNTVQLSAMILATFALAILSWRYVETPFRKRSLFPKQRELLGASTVALVTVFGAGFVLVGGSGLPNRYVSTAGAQTSHTDPEWEYWTDCEERRAASKSSELCDIGIPNGEPRFILWGDSHAKALASGVALSAANQGMTGKIATQPSCPPLISIDQPHRRSCHKFNQQVLRMISDTPEITTVILAARWTLITKGTRFKQETGESSQWVDLQSPKSAKLTKSALFELGLRRTIDQLQSLGLNVVIVGPVPEIGYDVPSSYFIATITGRDINTIISPTVDEYIQRTKQATAILAEVVTNDGSISMIEPSNLLCSEEFCRVVDDGNALYRDDDHLSTFGSRYVSKELDRVFTQLKARGS